MNFTTRKLVTRSEKILATRKRNERKRKMFRAYVWYLAYSFVTIITVTLCIAWYQMSFTAVYDAAVKQTVIPVSAEVTASQSVRDIISKATNGENVDVIYNLCTHESGTWMTHEEPCQKYSVNKNKNGTFDYSWLQVNDVHIIGRPQSKGKGTITMECVYDLSCVSKWANEKIKNGGGHIWVAWGSI